MNEKIISANICQKLIIKYFRHCALECEGPIINKTDMALELNLKSGRKEKLTSHKIKLIHAVRAET